jgi:Zn ribbon nucleic-acid-binding protein
MKGRRLTYDQVKQIIESDDGYRLLSTEYKNAQTKLKMMCPEGHTFSMRYGDFYTGYRCPVCAGNKRHTYEYVKNFIENEMYKLLSTEYKNAQTKLEIQCPEGHTFSMILNNFQQGQRCPDCKFNKQRHTYSYVKEYIEETGYRLLSTEYKNIKTKLKMMCPEGHIFKMSFNVFQSKHRCPICAGVKKLTFEDVKQNIENEGYKLLSTEYKNSRTKIEIQCTEGHIYKSIYNSFQQGKRCPICAAQQTSSKAEKELVQYVSSIYNGTIVENDRNTIVNHLTGMNLELDIFLPDINKAIEYNGSYWHSNRYSKIKDKIKTDQCKQKNIDLLVIDEQDWITDKTSCLTEIRSHII